MDKISGNAKEILEWSLCVVIAIVLALLVRTYVGTPTIVQHPSMYPTLESGQRLILNRLTITLGNEIKRGDIVTFEAPSEDIIVSSVADLHEPKAKYDNEPQNIFTKFTYYALEINKKSYIKRVIATQGEHVKIQDGKVFIDGKELKEDYLQPSVVTTSLNGMFTDLVVPEGYVYLLGDNRMHSTDSRSFGCIPIDKIESKVLVRFWPLDKIGKVE